MYKCKDKEFNCPDKDRNSICYLDIDTPCSNQIYIEEPQKEEKVLPLLIIKNEKSSTNIMKEFLNKIYNILR